MTREHVIERLKDLRISAQYVERGAVKVAMSHSHLNALDAALALLQQEPSGWTQPLPPPGPVDEARKALEAKVESIAEGLFAAANADPDIDALIAAVRADERQQAEAEIEGLKLSGADRLRWYHEIEAKLTAAQQEIARLKGERDQLDCTRREGGDTRHCNLDRKCLRCRAEAEGGQP